MSLFFPAPQTPLEPRKPPATTTLTLEKALTDAFIQALQAELGTALAVTAAARGVLMMLLWAWGRWRTARV
jgi:hypothetical protein